MSWLGVRVSVWLWHCGRSGGNCGDADRRLDGWRLLTFLAPTYTRTQHTYSELLHIRLERLLQRLFAAGGEGGMAPSTHGYIR